jgi:hypothetical protein
MVAMDTNDIIKQLTAERNRIDAAIKLLSGSALTKATPKKRGRRKMSKEARARIAKAQKARWAKQKKAAK